MKKYTDEELKEFEAIINSKLIQAEESFNRSCKDLNDMDPDIKSFDDNAEQMMTKENLTRMASRQEKAVKELKAAMMRVKNKTYGVCLVTGELIPKDRLNAIPQAMTTINAGR